MNDLFPAKNVGAPWLGRSVTSGSARQIARNGSARSVVTRPRYPEAMA